ncbi:hypothetical protein V1478_012297 [Vespula squamosa]|uniref:Uncharacterized protein n=1 Tax=Vespula squamosa TaxID=30214 RepID=A0ABD2ACU5_VESSQ
MIVYTIRKFYKFLGKVLFRLQRSSIIVIGIFPTCLSNVRQHCKVIDTIRLKCDFDTDFCM